MIAKKIPSIREIRMQNPLKLKHDPFVYFPDYITPYFIKFFLHTPVKANQISLISYLLYILSALLIAINQYVVLALIFLQIVVVLDGVDGAVARAKNQTTYLGLYYEYIFHETGPPLVFFALGSHLYLRLHNPLYLFLGGIIVIAQLMINSFGTSKQRIMYEKIMRERRISSAVVQSSLLKKTKNLSLHMLLRLVNVLPNFGFSIGVITLGYIFGLLKYVLLFYFVYFCVIAFLKATIELIAGFKPYGLK